MSLRHHPLHRRAALMLVLTTLLWGISFPVIKGLTMLNGLLIPGAGGWFLSAGALAPRFLVASVGLLVLQGRRGVRPTGAEVRQGATVGCLASAGMLLQTDGLQYTQASVSAFLTQFLAVLIPVWMVVRHRRNPGARFWMCACFVIAGVGVLGRVDLHALRLGRGEWETLAGSGFFAAQIVRVAHNEDGGMRTGVVTLVMFVCQAALFSAIAFATMPNARALLLVWASPSWVALTLVLGLLCTIGAFSIMNAWQPKVSASEAGLIYCIEPVSASAFALFLPALISRASGIAYADEHITASLLTGGGLILAANIVLNLVPEPARASSGGAQ